MWLKAFGHITFHYLIMISKILPSARSRGLIFAVVLFSFLSGHSSFAFGNSLTSDELLEANKIFSGDLDQMVERRVIRVLLPYNRAFFFFEGAQPKGISYENVILFEKFLNERLKTGTLKIRLLIVPVSRDSLFGWLAEGRGDIAIGNLTITDEREKHVDFSDPFAKNVSEILITHASQPELMNILDLAGTEVHVRRSSSYFEHLQLVNEVLRGAGKDPIIVVEADERLEDSDLAEMVNAGVIPSIIMDDHKGKLWRNVFEDIRLHPQVKINSGGRIGWAIRKNSPKLKAVINEYVKGHKAGTLLGNVIINRYLKNADYISNPTAGKEREKFDQKRDLFHYYGEQYTFDHLLLMALAYQESRLDQNLKSHVGAVGVMQILPSTAADDNVGIANIEQLENNIHAGAKYLRFLADRYFPEDEGYDRLDRAFFTFAAYNAGPARVAALRREAGEMGLDPNSWFNNVEVVAAKRIGRETVQYVSNIMKYYVAYKLLADRVEFRQSKGITAPQ